MIALLPWVAGVWSGTLGAVACWAWVLARPGRAQAPLAHPTAILLRPCAGDEPSLVEALRSSESVHPAVAVRFLVAEAADGAAPIAGAVAAALRARGRDARLVVTRAFAPNRKAAQLARALEVEVERASVVLVADSDVALSRATLEAILSRLTAGASAAWAPPIEVRPRTWADRVSAAVLDSSLHAFPLLAGLDPRGMVGKCFAIRRDALDAIGGFGALAHHLGEDMELSRRLRARGMTVRAGLAPASSLASGRSWTDVVGRYSRWLAVIRAQRPPLLATYPTLLAATPLVLALALGSAASAVDGPSRSATVGAVLTVRWAIALLARHRSARPLRVATALFAGLAADVLLLLSFARACAGRGLVWRGVRLRLAPGGSLEPGE